MKTKMKMTCTNCGTQLDVDELLIKQFEQSIRRDLQEELQKREEELNEQREEFKLLSIKLKKEKEDVNEIVAERVRKTLRANEEAFKDKIRQEVNEEKSKQLQILEDELIKKSAQLREFNGTRAQLERLQREMEEKEATITLQKERELTERLEQAKLSIKEQVQQESFLRLREREKVIEDLKEKLDDAKRKAEQGSMQLQGEIQELEIIELLQEFHPTDEITQSKKGANAADILQVVRTQNGSECGKIYYESKRTKSWSNEWISKFKHDNIETKADILVLVTNTLPKGIEKYGIVDGIWVCRFQDVKELSLVLRYGLLKVQSIAIKQTGKESKMELLYNYLSSEEFRNLFESIINGFKEIQESHNSEKLKMQRLWKEREKALERVLTNSVDFYGSLKGIAGSSIPEIESLAYLPKAS